MVYYKRSKRIGAYKQPYKSQNRRRATEGVVGTVVDLTRKVAAAGNRASKEAARRKFIKERGWDPSSGVKGGTGSTWTKATKTKRKPAIMSQITKLMKRSVFREIQRYGQVNPLYNTDGSEPGGAFRMTYEGNATSASTSWSMPLYILELAKTVDPISSPHVAMHRLRFNKSNSSIFWYPTAGADNFGTPDNTMTWLQVKAPEEGGYASAPVAICDWVSLKFTIRCPTSRSGYFKVQLVQFPEVKFIPNNATGTDVDAFWQKQVKPLVYNPASRFVSSPQGTWKEMKVLKTWVRKFDADTTDDRDTTGDRIHFTIFERLNRIFDFRKKGGTRVTVSEMNDDNAGAESYEMDTLQSAPSDSKARMFFIITASTYDPPSAEQAVTPDYSKHLTFDLDARVAWLSQYSRT